MSQCTQHFNVQLEKSNQHEIGVEIESPGMRDIKETQIADHKKGNGLLYLKLLSD